MRRRTWGRNDYKEGAVPFGLTNIMAMAGGLRHTVALTGEGTVIGWGTNDFGQGLGQPQSPVSLAQERDAAIAGHLPAGETGAQGALLYGWKLKAFGVTNCTRRSGRFRIHFNPIDIGPRSPLRLFFNEFFGLATNVAGFFTWGYNAYMGNTWVTNGVQFFGQSRWCIIETGESYNGVRTNYQAVSIFLEWFSTIALGGTNYSNS